MKSYFYTLYNKQNLSFCLLHYNLFQFFNVSVYIIKINYIDHKVMQLKLNFISLPVFLITCVFILLLFILSFKVFCYIFSKYKVKKKS